MSLLTGSSTESGASQAVATAVLVTVAAATLVGAMVAAFGGYDGVYAGGYVRLDAATRLFLVLVDTVFLGLAVHLWGRARADLFRMPVSPVFVALNLGFLAAANLVVLSNHLLAAWIALELTTFAAAPLVASAGTPASRRASWRYFLFSTVGLGLVLLGFVCISRGLWVEGYDDGLFVGELIGHVPGGSNPWRTLGVALAVLGYGTKLGLAPMYIWLPETYEEAPPAVTALLAAVQFNATLLGLVRVLQVFRPVDGPMVSQELVALGLASVAVATASLIATRGLRRLVAFASIVHGGVIAIGLGVGGNAAYGVLLYAISNAFIKAILFVTAGRIEAWYGTKDTSEIRAVLRIKPSSGAFLMIGTFALLGFPPFGSFLGELLVLSGLVQAGYLFTFAALAVLVSVTFLATGRTVFPMIWGESTRHVEPAHHSFVSNLPGFGFLVALVALGIHLPEPVNELLKAVAVSLGAQG